ncbi:MAG: hypothetical protein PHT12_03425 [Patescibacteria group bacterium]|nr:hypothetical protein [Patescibacteria group bacterium]
MINFFSKINGQIRGSESQSPTFPPAALIVAGLAIGTLVALSSPWKIFAFLLAAAVFALAFYRPESALYFIVAYIPLEPFLLKFLTDDVYVYAKYFSEVLVYAVVAAAVIRVLSRRRPWVPTPIDLPFAFFLLVALSSLVVNAVPPFIGILGLRQIIRFILLFFAVAYLAPNREFARRLSYLMLVIAFLEAGLGIVQWATGGYFDEFLLPSARRFFEDIQLSSGTDQFWEPGTRVFATLGRYDQLGTFLCFFLLLAVGWLYELKAVRQRQPLFLFVVVAVVALLLTLSRASWFGFIGAFFVIGAMLKGDRRVRTAFVAVIIAAVAYWGYSGLVVRYLTDYPGQTPIERFFESFSYERWRGEYYGLGRLYWMVQTPLVVVRSSPLLGVGPGQYGGGAAAALGNTRVYERLNLPFGVYGSEGYIDNNWFSLWGETGTLGLIFYLWMFGALALMALHVWREAKDPFLKGMALGYFGCLLAVTFQAFLATYLEVRTLALYVWLYGGLVYALARREKIYA